MLLLRKLKCGPVQCLVWDRGIQWPRGHWDTAQDCVSQSILGDIQLPHKGSPAATHQHNLGSFVFFTRQVPCQLLLPGGCEFLLETSVLLLLSGCWNPWNLMKLSLYWLVLGMYAINISCGQWMTDTGNKCLFSLRVYAVALVKR